MFSDVQAEKVNRIAPVWLPPQSVNRNCFKPLRPVQSCQNTSDATIDPDR